MMSTGKGKILMNTSSCNETTHTWLGHWDLMRSFGSRFCSCLSQHLRTLNTPAEAQPKLEDEGSFFKTLKGFFFLTWKSVTERNSYKVGRGEICYL